MPLNYDYKKIYKLTDIGKKICKVDKMSHINIKRNILTYLKDNNKLAAFESFDRKLLHIMSDDVLEKIHAGASIWEDDVPVEVVKAIKFYELFGYHPKAENSVAR